MWVFYMFSLPVAIGMVIVTLNYFSGPDVPKYVFFTVAYTWFCSVSIVILVPADIWTGYEDAGDFTVKERLRTSLHGNLVFYLSGNISGFAMACSNTFGLVTGAFLLGFGLSEIPKGIWLNADWNIEQKVLSHKVAKMAVKLDDAHRNFSNAIVITQATSKQMSKRDSLRPYMNIIDRMLLQMEDPSFKPQGGRLGESDMDYDSDEKSMASLRRRLKRAREQYYRYRSEYTKFVLEALELEDTIKNYERRDTTGWFVLTYTFLIFQSLHAEATILTSGVDLSLFSILVHAAGQQEVLVQLFSYMNLKKGKTPWVKIEDQRRTRRATQHPKQPSMASLNR
ncbi:hypothetical protein V8G54_004984 [Vigna mungo]|uniref:LMBR1-like membrane protein n=1 Tax=Vigna mungo TaxID=3915 RepID=A0AAQ3PFR0_VIGMU